MSDHEPAAVPPATDPTPSAAGVLALVIAWSVEEPERVGEVMLVPPGASVLGRGEGQAGVPRLTPVRQRPGAVESTGPLRARSLSRQQVGIEATGDGLVVRNLGRAPLRIGGWPVDTGEVGEGGLVEVTDRLLLLCERRPVTLEAGPVVHTFGEPDAYGFVGESPAAWAVRHQVHELARTDVAVLVRGPSGSGKELAARALHGQSSRADRPMVARSAAVFGHGAADAASFEATLREAAGTTLLLDEIGALPERLQRRLLQATEVRLVAATRRDVADALVPELQERFAATVMIPGLSARAADVPLVARHLLQRQGERYPELGDRFLDESGYPRCTARFVSALLRRVYTAGVRELSGLLWEAMALAETDVLDESDEVRFVPGPDATASEVDPSTIPLEVIQAALARHDGVREKVWKDLGLRNRFQLHRLLHKHGLDT